MAISILIRYLQQPNHDYLEGVALYNQFGYNSTLKHLFSLGKTEYNQQKLIAELKLLADKLTDKPKPQAKAPVIESKKQQIIHAELPTELRQLNIRKGEAYNEMSHYHRELTVVNSNKERAALVAKIKELNAEINDIWQQLDHWQATKTFLRAPEPVLEIKAPSHEEAFKRLLNVRANISKLKKNPKRVDDLAKLETEKVELETILGK